MIKANIDDRLSVVSILSRAFDDNKSVNYVVKQGTARKKRIGKLMEYSFDICNNFGEVWLSDNKEACALILFPDQKRISLKTIFWDTRLAVSVIGLNRVKRVMEREAKIKALHPPGPFTYLWFIGVDSARQGEGVGSRLLQEVIEVCQRKQRPIFLETSVEQNLSWYKKFGFEVYNFLDLSYRLYFLRREFN